MSAEASLPIEVSDEPLVGWRCWHVLPHEGLLRPIFKRGLVWKPRQVLEALCPEEPHEVPAVGCRCGIWTVCHPLLLDEIGWTAAPPPGTARLPGILVVGEVSLWGNILQHERGWRASCAYPRHLYVFTDDPMIAETLRERYGVPVEWGADAERLRRLLPTQAGEDQGEEETSLRETLLDVLRTGLCPKALEELAGAALDVWPDLLKSPEERIEKARAELAKATTADDRENFRWHLVLAAADARVLEGDTLAARRDLWVRVARARRALARDLFEKQVEPLLKQRDELVEDLARGTVPRGRKHAGQPYSASSLTNKQHELPRLEERIVELIPEIEKLSAVPIPTYREWGAIARGVVLGSRPVAEPPSDDLRRDWHRQAMRREAALAVRERALVLERHALIADRAEQRPALEALERDRAEVAEQRVSLRRDVIAGIEHDRAALLEEVGELERRRRAALAALPGPWPPAEAPKAAAAPSGEPRLLLAPPRHELRERLRERGITLTQIAARANCSVSSVSSVLSGRQKNDRLLSAAVALLTETEADRAAGVEAANGSADIEAAPAPSSSAGIGIGHPALRERLRAARIPIAAVAEAVGSSKALVSHALSGRLAGRRGRASQVVPAAERLSANVAGTALPPPPLPVGLAPMARSVREALLRERTELDAIRQGMLAARAELTAARHVVAQERKKVEAEAQTLAHASRSQYTRLVAQQLGRRLKAAGISRTQVARASETCLSNVSRTLDGITTSAAVVVAAERLLAKTKRR